MRNITLLVIYCTACEKGKRSKDKILSIERGNIGIVEKVQKIRPGMSQKHM